MPLALTLLVALLLAGCSPIGGSRTAVSSKVAQAQATHEYPSGPAPQNAIGGAADPAQAVRTFAAAYINWTASTVVPRMRALAAQSVGQARSAMELAAAQAAEDYELRRGGIANAGTVEAVAAAAGRRQEYVVVTRERTTASATTAYEGLRPAWHVAIADVVELPGGRWVVSRWQPES